MSKIKILWRAARALAKSRRFAAASLRAEQCRLRFVALNAEIFVLNKSLASDANATAMLRKLASNFAESHSILIEWAEAIECAERLG